MQAYGQPSFDRDTCIAIATPGSRCSMHERRCRHFWAAVMVRRAVAALLVATAGGVDLLIERALNLEGDAPFLFARRGEPFNYARDWANSSYAREGCWTLRDGRAASQICYTRPEGGDGDAVAPSVFEFLQRREALVARVDASVAANVANAAGPRPDIALGPVERQEARGTMLWQSGGTLAHGADQLDYLVAAARLPPDFGAAARGYRAAAADAAATLNNLDYEGCCFKAAPPHLARQHYLLNTLVYLPPPTRADGRAALNPATDWASVSADFAAGAVIVIDDVLAPWALAAARAFCLEATIYNELKRGYVGARVGPRLLGKSASLIRAIYIYIGTRWTG